MEARVSPWARRARTSAALSGPMTRGQPNTLPRARAAAPLTSATDPQLQVFIDTYASGQHAPGPGGECAGGNGTPTG